MKIAVYSAAAECLSVRRGTGDIIELPQIGQCCAIGSKTRFRQNPRRRVVVFVNASHDRAQLRPARETIADKGNNNRCSSPLSPVAISQPITDLSGIACEGGHIEKQACLSNDGGFVLNRVDVVMLGLIRKRNQIFRGAPSDLTGKWIRQVSPNSLVSEKGGERLCVGRKPPAEDEPAKRGPRKLRRSSTRELRHRHIVDAIERHEAVMDRTIRECNVIRSAPRNLARAQGTVRA